ncbi:hypothetical protein EX30DRAFT_341695 [Ascodesmis nigricans]|uniref:Uncharacterized protein n=1 Tax=Ascodesmis nigricans TaxID=341454 RepID=A0A4V3SIH5_9PEZI|nr:hypothetical protein EX30DRAFT_341695 [Ascodesmis nigricans]
MGNSTSSSVRGVLPGTTIVLPTTTSNPFHVLLSVPPPLHDSRQQNPIPSTFELKQQLMWGWSEDQEAMKRGGSSLNPHPRLRTDDNKSAAVKPRSSGLSIDFISGILQMMRRRLPMGWGDAMWGLNESWETRFFVFRPCQERWRCGSGRKGDRWTWEIEG